MSVSLMSLFSRKEMMLLILCAAISCASATVFFSSTTENENSAMSGTANTSPSPDTVIVFVADTPPPINLYSLIEFIDEKINN